MNEAKDNKKGDNSNKIPEAGKQMDETWGFPGGVSGKESACQCRRPRDVSLIPGLGRFSGGGNGNLLPYSCLENSMEEPGRL